MRGMQWTISYYSEVVHGRVLGLTPEILGHYLRIIDLITEYGPDIDLPNVTLVGDSQYKLDIIAKEWTCTVTYKHHAQEIVILECDVLTLKRTNQDVVPEMVSNY